MPSILIKDLSPAAHKRLRVQAKANHRSMQKEAARLLNAFLDPTPIPEYHGQLVIQDPPTVQEMVRDLKSGRR
jgi:plasmid stability protein